MTHPPFASQVPSSHTPDDAANGTERAVRRLVVWCPDWPVVAAVAAESGTPTGGTPTGGDTRAGGAMQTSSSPAAVFHANRVLACSHTARSEGVRRGMRRREAQGRCPELVVHDHDPDRDARLFEPVAAAVEAIAPGVEIVRPGLVAVPARGPARYFGSEDSAAERIVDEVNALGVECGIGIADGLFAAILAARRERTVEPGRSAEFLAPLPIDEVDRPADHGGDHGELVDLLRRLGMRTLGDFAALPASDVATRFGSEALLVHRLTGGYEERPPDRRVPSADLVVTEELDPPVDRVDAAAFVAKTLAQRLHERLSELGWACTRLGISARTENDEELHRVWRCAEPLTPAGTADRVRWQLDGWLNSRRSDQRPTAGVVVLSLSPDEVVSAGSLQLDLFDSVGTAEADNRAARAFVRVQGMLGPEAVVTGVLGGGRKADDRVRLVPWGDERSPAYDPEPPWPGRIPAPSPSMIPESPWHVDVLDELGCPVEITERHRLTGTPELLAIGGRTRPVVAWGGPWPLDERWWTTQARSRTRMQVVLASQPSTNDTETEGEIALLLEYEQSRWWVRGTYR